MIEKIIQWSINNKFMVVLITIFVVLGGTLAMTETPLDAIPDLSDVQVIIYTEYLGQAPQVVEEATPETIEEITPDALGDAPPALVEEPAPMAAGAAT